MGVSDPSPTKSSFACHHPHQVAHAHHRSTSIQTRVFHRAACPNGVDTGVPPHPRSRRFYRFYSWRAHRACRRVLCPAIFGLLVVALGGGRICSLTHSVALAGFFLLSLRPLSDIWGIRGDAVCSPWSFTFAYTHVHTHLVLPRYTVSRGRFESLRMAHCFRSPDMGGILILSSYTTYTPCIPWGSLCCISSGVGLGIWDG